MKKRILTITFICACLIAVSTAVFGSAQSESLVTKSYLEGIYLQELQGVIAARTAVDLGEVRDSAVQRLKNAGQENLTRLDSATGDLNAWLNEATFTEQGGERGDTVTLASGSGLIWTAGSATVSGTLIDLTSGSSVSDGALTENHRYVASGQCVVTVSSRTAHWCAEGVWKTTSDGISVSETVFVDVPEGSWYYDAVYYVVDKGLFLGKSSTEFVPDPEMSRSMLATVLHRLAGKPSVTYRPIFADVPDGTWYTAGSVWAAENNIAIGWKDGNFNPTEDVSRQELVVTLYNYANWAGYDTSQRADLSKYPDGDQVPAEVMDAVSWAVAADILRGGSGGKLLLSEATGRAQVATMIWRFTNWIEAI